MWVPNKPTLLGFHRRGACRLALRILESQMVRRRPAAPFEIQKCSTPQIWILSSVRNPKVTLHRHLAPMVTVHRYLTPKRGLAPRMRDWRGLRSHFEASQNARRDRAEILVGATTSKARCRVEVSRTSFARKMRPLPRVLPQWPAVRGAR